MCFNGIAVNNTQLAQHKENSPDQQPEAMASLNQPSSGLLRRITNQIRDRLGIFAIAPFAVLPEAQYEKLFKAFFDIPANPTEATRELTNHHIGGKVYWGLGDSPLGRNVERLTSRFSSSKSHEQRNMQPHINSVGLPINGLPADLEGVAVYHITDPHVSSLETFFSPEMLKKLVDQLNTDIEKEAEYNNKPKIVIFTGDLFTDYVDGLDIDLLSKTKEALKGLKADHKFAILGNHDYIIGKDKVKELLEECGFTVLENEASDYIEIGDSRLQITGADSVMYGEQDPGKLFHVDVTDNVTQLHLVHEPMGVLDVQRYDTNNRIAGVFSGHTHGGKSGAVIGKILRVLDGVTEKVNGRKLSEANLVKVPDLSLQAFDDINDDSHASGIFYDQEGRMMVVHPGIGQIYTPLRELPSSVTKNVLCRKDF